MSPFNVAVLAAACPVINFTIVIAYGIRLISNKKMKNNGHYNYDGLTNMYGLGWPSTLLNRDGGSTGDRTLSLFY